MSIHDQPLDDTDCFDEADEFESVMEELAFTEDDDVSVMFDDGTFTETIRKRFDDIYACTCAKPPAQGHGLYLSHETECKVRLSKLWQLGLAEWSHSLKRFLYYPVPEDDEIIESSPPEPGLKTPPQSTDLFSSAGWDYSMAGYGGGYAHKCRHEHQAVTFPDSTVIHAASSDQKSKDRVKPDYGFYAYEGFSPRPDITTFIKWADFGLPYADLPAISHELKRALALTRQGFDVEVGCMGGHGRTGTMLACMATLCGIPASEAVAWVQKAYCAEAVESDEQEWYVLAFDCFQRGEEPPPKPKPKPKAPLPVRNGWCPECKGKVTTTGCDGFGCEHKGCRLYNVKHDLPAVLLTDPNATEGGDAHDSGRAQGNA